MYICLIADDLSKTKFRVEKNNRTLTGAVTYIQLCPHTPQLQHTNKGTHSIRYDVLSINLVFMYKFIYFLSHKYTKLFHEILLQYS